MSEDTKSTIQATLVAISVGVLIVVFALLTSCAAFDAFLADPAAMKSAEQTAMLTTPWPLNLIVPGAFAMMAALGTPKEKP